MSTKRIAMIRQRLESQLTPDILEIEDDSASHAGHAGASQGGHFNVMLVSSKFNDLSLIKRHRLIYNAVDDLMQTEIHALSIKSLTPDEYQVQQHK